VVVSRDARPGQFRDNEEKKNARMWAFTAVYLGSFVFWDVTRRRLFCTDVSGLLTDRKSRNVGS
jgi:hypothetical protein